MFAGERDQRHREPRRPARRAAQSIGRPMMVDGRDVMPDVRAALDHMRTFSEAVRSGAWLGYTGLRITDVVNIGIGGSDLGPAMVTQALTPVCTQKGRARTSCRTSTARTSRDTLRPLHPATTLFTVASKTFTTQETMANAQFGARVVPGARQGRGGDREALRRHLDQRGGSARSSASRRRTCSCSGTGLAAAIRCGRRSACRSRWRSATATSSRCSTARTRWTSTSAPRRSSRTCRCVLGLLGVWYASVLGADSHAVLPYEQQLQRLPGVSAAARNGKQRQARRSGRRACVDVPDLADRVGRARHQRPARLLPVAAPGHARWCRRDFLVGIETPRSARRSSPPAGRQLPRADRSADARQDRRRSARRAGGAGLSGAALDGWRRTRSSPATVRRRRSCIASWVRGRSACCWRCTSIASSRWARCGGSIRSTSGASSWASNWRRRLLKIWRRRPDVDVARRLNEPVDSARQNAL